MGIGFSRQAFAREHPVLIKQLAEQAMAKSHNEAEAAVAEIAVNHMRDTG